MTIRSKFTLIFFIIPFGALFLLIFLLNSSFSTVLNIIIFSIYLIIFLIKINSYKCPRCGLKLLETYKISSKYYKGAYHRVPQECPCCGQNLECIVIKKNELDDNKV